MRPLEVIVLLAAAVLTVVVLAPRQYRHAYGGTWVWFVCIAAAFVTLAQLGLEGYRWQLIPAYVVEGCAIISLFITQTKQNQDRYRGVELFVGGLLALGIFMAYVTTTTFNIWQIAPPTGRYAVGTETFYIIDQNRPETYTPDQRDDKRELMLQVWYPAQRSSDNQPAAYISDVSKLTPPFAKQNQLPSWIFNYWGLVKSPAMNAPEPFPVETKMPLIVLTGERGFARWMYTGLCTELASHGMIVIGIDHPYSVGAVIMPDGRLITMKARLPDDQRGPLPPEEIEQKQLEHMQVRAQDISTVLDMVLGSEAFPEAISSKIDPNRIAVLGHGLGGGAAAQAALDDSRINAGIAFSADARGRPLTEGTRVPFFFANSPQRSAPNLTTEQQNLLLLPQQNRQTMAELAPVAYEAIIVNTSSGDFTDLAFNSDVLRWPSANPIDGTRLQFILSQYIRSFLNATLDGQSAPLLNGNSGSYPEVTLRQVEPKTLEETSP